MKLVRERQILYDLTYIWNLKNKQNKNRLIGTENKQVGARGDGAGGKIGEGV